MTRVAAIVLAAGASTRLGRPKQLLLYDGETLIKRAVLAAIAAGASPVVAVLGANADAIAPALSGIDGVTMVTNIRWQDGLASSLATGVSAVTAIAPESEGVLITVADQPLVDGIALQHLVQTFDRERRIVAAEYAGTVGVPVVVGREHLSALCALHGEAGAGAWLRAHRSAATTVPMPEAAVDVDTPDDAASLSGADTGESTWHGGE